MSQRAVCSVLYYHWFWTGKDWTWGSRPHQFASGSRCSKKKSLPLLEMETEECDCSDRALRAAGVVEIFRRTAMSLLDEDARQVKSCDKAADALSGMGSAYSLVFSILDIGDARRFGKWSAVSSKEHNSPLIRPDMKFLKLFPQNMFLKENSIKPTNKMFPPPRLLLEMHLFCNREMLF